LVSHRERIGTNGTVLLNAGWAAQSSGSYLVIFSSFGARGKMRTGTKSSVSRLLGFILHTGRI
jgi:hypothetical protein